MNFLGTRRELSPMRDKTRKVWLRWPKAAPCFLMRLTPWIRAHRRNFCDSFRTGCTNHSALIVSNAATSALSRPPIGISKTYSARENFAEIFTTGLTCCAWICRHFERDAAIFHCWRGTSLLPCLRPRVRLKSHSHSQPCKGSCVTTGPATCASFLTWSSGLSYSLKALRFYLATFQFQYLLCRKS